MIGIITTKLPRVIISNLPIEPDTKHDYHICLIFSLLFDIFDRSVSECSR